MKVLLAGGGTGGPVMPLIAVYQRLKEMAPDAEFLLIDLKGSPGEIFARHYGINSTSIPAGKWHRYFTLKNVAAPFQALAGFFKSFSIIFKFMPDIVFAAGGYVSVPVVVAAFAQQRKIVVHQQDVRPSLTNKLLAPLANRITVSFESSIKKFDVQSGLKRYVQKVVWTGNPVRSELLRKCGQKEIGSLKNKFGVNRDIPVIAVFGGATGAVAINQLVEKALPELTNFAAIIHVTGKGKKVSYRGNNYHPFEIIDNMPELIAIADIVIARAGMSTIAELSAAAKASIMIPIPDSHQEDNALLLEDAGAAIIFDQKTVTSEELVSTVRRLMLDGQWQRDLKKNISAIMPKDGAEKIAKIIFDLCKTSRVAKKI